MRLSMSRTWNWARHPVGPLQMIAVTIIIEGHCISQLRLYSNYPQIRGLKLLPLIQLMNMQCGGLQVSEVALFSRVGQCQLSAKVTGPLASSSRRLNWQGLESQSGRAQNLSLEPAHCPSPSILLATVNHKARQNSETGQMHSHAIVALIQEGELCDHFCKQWIK